jgi:tryptophan-rich sensory protein
MEIKNFVRLILAILVCEIAGIIGSLFTSPAIPAWYDTLTKPSFTPPSWVFGPAWVILYALMGASLYVIRNKRVKNKRVKASLEVFGVQLVLNVLWSFLFFGLRSPLYGLIAILALWIAILLTIKKFSQISKKAAILLIPYILWVTFAMILNLYVWVLN